MFLLEMSYGCTTAPYGYHPNTGIFRSARKDGIKLWDEGVVPYELKSSENLSSTFLMAVKQIEDATCLMFKKRTSEAAYVRVESMCECSKYSCQNTGSVTGLGKLSPSTIEIHACVRPDREEDVGFLVHEIGHSLGLVHTQTRPDRDEHIRVNTRNIISQESEQFQYKKCSACLTYNTSYDCMSVMHYRDHFLRKPGVIGPTMTPVRRQVYQLVYKFIIK